MENKILSIKQTTQKQKKIGYWYDTWEKVKTYNLIAYNGDQEIPLTNPLTVEFFQPRNGETVRCLFRFDRPGEQTIYGIGKATGSGYDKKSAAFQKALVDAGVEIESPISGVGETAIKGVINAFSVLLWCSGNERFLIVES